MYAGEWGEVEPEAAAACESRVAAGDAKVGGCWAWSGTAKPVDGTRWWLSKTVAVSGSKVIRYQGTSLDARDLVNGECVYCSLLVMMLTLTRPL